MIEGIRRTIRKTFLPPRIRAAAMSLLACGIVLGSALADPATGPAHPTNSPPRAAAPATRKSLEEAAGEIMRSPAAAKAAAVADLAQETAFLPIVAADGPQKIISIGIAGDMLSPRCELSVTAESRVICPAMPGVVTISPLGPGDAPPPAAAAPDPANAPAGPINFTFMWRDLTPPGAKMIYTELSNVAGRTQISRECEDETELTSVQLIQDPPPPGGGPQLPGSDDPVRLIVRQTNLQGGKDIDVRLTATTFVELREKHPHEIAIYLRPILNDLGQGNVASGATAASAWQVLGGNYAPDVATRDAASAALASLSADDFKAREAAQGALEKMGGTGAAALARIAATQPALSPEQQRSVELILKQYQPMSANATAAARDDAGFLFDCVLLNDPTVVRLAVGRLGEVLGRPTDIDPAADLATRMRAVATIRKSLEAATTRPSTTPATRGAGDAP